MIGWLYAINLIPNRVSAQGDRCIDGNLLCIFETVFTYKLRLGVLFVGKYTKGKKMEKPTVSLSITSLDQALCRRWRQNQRRWRMLRRCGWRPGCQCACSHRKEGRREFGRPGERKATLVCGGGLDEGMQRKNRGGNFISYAEGRVVLGMDLWLAFLAGAGLVGAHVGKGSYETSVRRLYFF